MAVLAMAAMAFVVLGGFAVFRDLLGAVTGGEFAASQGSSANDGPEFAGPPAEPSVRAQVSLWASGTDYRAETLADFPNVRLPALAPGSPDLLASPLPALANESSFQACLAAVETRYAGQVTAADFARYEGQPALILLIQGPQGPLVVAVGDDCGRAGLDEKAAVLAD